jgi:hypothetical protein
MEEPVRHAAADAVSHVTPEFGRRASPGPMWAQVSAKLHGDNKLRSAASISKKGSSARTGFGGHFRAIQGFRYVEGA